MPRMDPEWFVGILVVVVIVAFVVFAFLFPEWVGIQGKVAKEIEKEHRAKDHDDGNTR